MQTTKNSVLSFYIIIFFQLTLRQMFDTDKNKVLLPHPSGPNKPAQRCTLEEIVLATVATWQDVTACMRRSCVTP